MGGLRFLGLTIEIPRIPKISETCNAIRAGKPHIKHDIYLSNDEAKQLIKALRSEETKPNSIEVLDLENAFSYKSEDRYDQLMEIVKAAIPKVKKLLLGKNSFSLKFIDDLPKLSSEAKKHDFELIIDPWDPITADEKKFDSRKRPLEAVDEGPPRKRPRVEDKNEEEPEPRKKQSSSP